MKEIGIMRFPLYKMKNERNWRGTIELIKEDAIHGKTKKMAESMLYAR